MHALLCVSVIQLSLERTHENLIIAIFKKGCACVCPDRDQYGLFGQSLGANLGKELVTFPFVCGYFPCSRIEKSLVGRLPSASQRVFSSSSFDSDPV